MCAPPARCCHCPRNRALKFPELEIRIRMSVIEWCERGLIPDRLARVGMRKLMALRLVDESAGNGEARAVRFSRFLADLRRSEEHTSELQSLMRISYAVFCLQKKKTNKQRERTD